MAITASEVNKLRQQTGAGMMDCKKALTETDGDFQAAIDLLRKKGQKIAEKRGDRDATEGVVLAKATDSKGVVIALNCETDFVAKNDDFVGLATSILDVALSKQPTSINELKELPLEGSLTVGEKITEKIGTIGEKIDISSYELVEAECVVGYNHHGNRLASIVGLNKSGDNLNDAAKDVAMQVAAMNPIAIDETDVSEEVKQRELKIGMDQAREEGKPEQMLEKIAEGKLKKYFKESTLLNQIFVKDGKKSVRDYLKGIDSDLTVKVFKRISL